MPWGTSWPKCTTMPRAGLTSGRVIEEAEHFADEVGLTSITMAALAQRLGVRQPSLYKHVDSMEGLQRSIALRAKNELADTLARATVGRARAAAIMSLARAYRTWAMEHPGRYAAVQRAFVPEDVEGHAADYAVFKIVADVINGYGLLEDDAIDAIRALRAALHGFVVLEAGGGFGLPVDIERSFERLILALETALTSWTKNVAPRSRT
jgi:AcrR family transcriptional regulator